jgi:2-polyprenyl-3-methyl-5-hydroxy-6-metoxy-1,4-benzoquinol methylase
MPPKPGEKKMLRLVVAAAIAFSGPLHAQEQKRSSQEVWNELFAKREGVEHRFNKFLAESVKERKPGKALDVGMGQGRNSLFLAALGWDVTGFDISDVAVRQAQAERRRGASSCRQWWPTSTSSTTARSAGT